MSTKYTRRYADQELSVFRELINAKLATAKEQVGKLQQQLIETTQNASDAHGTDWVDDSSLQAELEMLNNMAIRQSKYLKELENALTRIRNKTYGICVITGELIDKRRLMAVPTTTKSVAAKKNMHNNHSSARPGRAAVPTKKKVISRVRKQRPRLNRPPLPASKGEELLSALDLPSDLEELPLDQQPGPEELDAS